MKKILIAAITLSVALVSCQKETVRSFDSNEMRLDVRFPGATKATATNFEPGDCRMFMPIILISEPFLR